MELTDILIDLSNSKAALEVANHTIHRMKGKCIRKNIFKYIKADPSSPKAA